MRAESSVVSLSWIPSESVQGWLRAGFDLGLSHYDRPPTDRLPGVGVIERMRADGRFRFANVLAAWVEFDDDGTPVRWGYSPGTGLVMGATTISVASIGATFAGFGLPTLRPDPVAGPGGVRFTQTVGGRTAVPLPRAVPHAPFVMWQAPIVWTTLALTIHADGSAQIEMPGASAFPRHWVYGPDGDLRLKSGFTDLDGWLDHSFGTRTPWGDHDAAGPVTEAESLVERELSAAIMRGGRSPEIRRLAAGSLITKQGEPGSQVFLLLDGVLAVRVDETEVARVGPGAILGERAVLEGGLRTSTLVALTPVRLAVGSAEDLDIDKLRAISELHRREDARATSPAGDE